MDIIDWILNLACVLLWLNWRSIRFITVLRPIGVSLVGTLRRADQVRTPRWSSLAALLAILFIRALFYCQIGSAINWTPTLQLGAVALRFRSNHFPGLVLFSFLGFAVWLFGLYSWLLLLSAVNGQTPDTDPWQRLIRLHLGKAERAPAIVKSLLPAVAAMLFWIVSYPLLTQQEIVPRAQTEGQLFLQAAVLGLASVLFWKFLVIGLLVLHIVHSYLYLGENPFWQFVSTTAKHLLRPLSLLRLRVGKVDLLPLAGIAIVMMLAELIQNWLPRIYQYL